MNRKLVLFVVVSLLALASLACTLGGLLSPGTPAAKGTPALSIGKSTPTAAATAPSVTLPSNPKAAILQSAAKLRDLKSYRMKTVIESHGNTMTTVQAVIAPNKVHLTTDYGQVIHIGDDVYTKSGNTWTKTTQPGQMIGPKPYVTADMIQDERKEGAETLDGVACDKFFYKTKAGDKPSMDVTVWIGTKDGLPYKIVTSTSSGAVTQTLYDVGANIKIEPPVVGLASGPTATATPASGKPTATATRPGAQASPSPGPTVAALPGWTHFTTQNGLGHNDVKSVAVAADGAVWAGTNGGGLSRFDGKTWTTYLEKDGLTFKTVQAVAIAPGGVVWAGTLGGGVSRFDGKTWTTYKEKDGLPGGSIQSIVVAADGTAWFATNKGVARYDGKAWKSYTTQDGLAYDTVWSVALAPNGALWAGTWQGVSSFDGKTWMTYKAKDGLAKDLLNAVAVDGDGVMWAGTGGNGASRFDGKTWMSYGMKENLGLIVQAIATAPGGVVWFGTTVGATRFNGKAWTNYTIKNGLVNDNVQAIAVGKDGAVWFGTKGGVSRYEP